MDQVAKAAIFLRERGLCHRDIKSANIFVTDDFEQVTLLDLSVMREINDPMGLGTDHGDRLPVVATARYSPPDYLFRLLDPGPDAWKALDVYQLGALLHDLIMRKPLFETAYQSAKDNRYRFAWTVATVDPLIEAEDVDADLLVLARRALDKDWQRRLSLDLVSFLNNERVLQTRALELVGFQRSTRRTLGASIGEIRDRLRFLADEVRALLSDELLSNGVRCKHEISWSDDSTVHLQFSWNAGYPSEQDYGDFALRVTIRNDETTGGLKALPSATLVQGKQEVGVELPAVPWTVQPADLIAKSVMHTIGSLATSLMQLHPTRSS